MIGANLLKGKMVLMKVASNRVSSLKGTRLQAVSAKSECEDELSDKEVKAQLEVNSK